MVTASNGLSSYGRWFISDTSAQLAFSLNAIVVPLLAFEVTGSTLTAGVIGSATAISSLVCMLPGGLVGDSFSRRKIIVYGALFQALILSFGVAAFYAGVLNSLLLTVLAVSVTTVGTLTIPGQNAALRNIVPENELPKALSFNQSRDAAIGIGSNPLGGLLFSFGAIIPWIVGSVLQLVAAVAGRSIPDPMLPGNTHQKGLRNLFKNLSFGLVYLFKNRLLLALCLIAALLNFSSGGIMTAIILGLRSANTSASEIGLILGIGSAGALVGGIASGKLIDRFASGKLLVVGFFYEALMLSTVAFMPANLWISVSLFLTFLAIPAVNAASGGFIMAIVPIELQARASAAISLVAMILSPLAPLGAGYGVGAIGMQATIIAFSASFALPLAIVLFSKPIRELPKPAAWKEYAQQFTVQS